MTEVIESLLHGKAIYGRLLTCDNAEQVCARREASGLHRQFDLVGSVFVEEYGGAPSDHVVELGAHVHGLAEVEVSLDRAAGRWIGVRNREGESVVSSWPASTLGARPIGYVLVARACGAETTNPGQHGSRD